MVTGGSGGIGKGCGRKLAELGYDVVLAARGPVAFVDPRLPREAHLISAHGSMTAAEMQVPLLAGRAALG